MVRNFLVFYEQWFWVQINWILVWFWRGCGFGYCYIWLLYLLKIKFEDVNLFSFQKFCFFILLQQYMVDFLQQGFDVVFSFFNSVFNQFNWVFFEFIGMIQEIQQVVECLEWNFVDSWQFKVCVICFDFLVSLLCVLEMIIILVFEIFFDWIWFIFEMLLWCFVQLLNQVLN